MRDAPAWTRSSRWAGCSRSAQHGVNGREEKFWERCERRRRRLGRRDRAPTRESAENVSRTEGRSSAYPVVAQAHPQRPDTVPRPS